MELIVSIGFVAVFFAIWLVGFQISRIVGILEEDVQEDRKKKEKNAEEWDSYGSD